MRKKFNNINISVFILFYCVSLCLYLYYVINEVPLILIFGICLFILLVIVSSFIDENDEEEKNKKRVFIFNIKSGSPTFYLYLIFLVLMNIFGIYKTINYIKSNLTYADFTTLMGFTKPANDTMFSIVSLLSEMTILLTFILFGVLIALAYIVDVFNAKSNPYPRHFEKSIESTLDVLFVVFPTLIIIYILVPSLGFIFNNETIVETVFDLDIVGHQWYWSYEYSLSIGISLYDIYTNQNSLFCKIEFDSLLDQEAVYNRLLQVDKRVIIPVNTYIKATVTSQDVIHSWAVPQLGVKYDAVPGRLISFILNSNVLGIFYGQCSELCGVNHAFTPICVQAVESRIFLDWVLCSLNINPSKQILESFKNTKFVFYDVPANTELKI